MGQEKLSIGITGSHGFIGSHLTKALGKLNRYDLVLFDRKRHDLLDEKSLKTFVSDRDVVFHIAGANRDTNANLFNVNALGTLNLLEAIKQYGKKKIKFIFTSSIQVYTSSNSNLALKEEEKLPFSNTVFGNSKIAAESLIRLCDIDSIVFRASNSFGPNSKPFYNSVIATFCYLAANGKVIKVDGDGEQKRDFIFISDLIDGLIKAIDYKSKGKEIFNIGSGKLTSLNQIIKIIRKVSGKSVSVEYSSDEHKANKWVLTDQKRIYSKLGWKPKVDIENGLEETFIYFDKNRDYD